MMYFIDFDDTIFNTGKFAKDFKNIFAKYNISEIEFNESYVPCREGNHNKAFKDYDLEKQLIDIESRHGKMPILRKELNSFVKSSSKYIFDDFYEFVKKVPKNNIFLVSYGSSSFQKLKIENSSVLNYVHDYVLTKTNKADCIDKIFSRNKQGERRLTFIDDRPDQLEKVQRKYPNMLIYRMKRLEGRYGEIPMPKNIPEIKKLTTILK